jgi:DNA polymerase (family 10)
MDKWEVARALDEIGNYLELNPANKFKAVAFQRASRAVSALDKDLEKLAADRTLYDVSGIGKATGAVIEELLSTGASRYLAELRQQYPPGIFELLRVPKLGLRKIGVLHSELGVSSLDELEAAGKSGRIAKLKGFGAKTQEKILEGIAHARKRQSHFLLPWALDVGETFRRRLAEVDAVENAEISGSVRRRLEVVRNVNIVIATSQPAKVIQSLEQMIAGFELIDPMNAKGIDHDEMEVLFHLAKPAQFGSRLFETTGSAEFVGAFPAIKPAADEDDVFRAAKIAWVPPERRESAEAIQKKKQPKLVELDDLRGTFHVHTTYSDGRNTVAEMLDAAQERGFEYVGISDHSKSAYYAGGLNEERLKTQQAEIARESRRVKPMRVFRGTEADILVDGGIDYDDATLATFDFVIASVHSRFNMPKDEMTERIVRACQSPFVTFIGHLTGRLLLSRDGYTMDFDRVFEEAGKRAVMIEINGNPRRLDIDWRLVRRALDRGVMFSIHPDAHSTREYGAMMTGTWAARKAGLSPNEIFNAREVDAVSEFLAARKKAALSLRSRAVGR